MTTAVRPPAPRTTDSRGLVALVATLVIAFAVVVGLTVVLNGHGRHDFSTASVDELTAAWRARGLTVCSSSGPSPGRADGGSVSVQTFAVARPGQCADAITVQADRYDNAAARDAAARNAEVNARPRVYGTVYTWHDYTVYLQADDASRDAGLRDKIVSALDSVGAR